MCLVHASSEALSAQRRRPALGDRRRRSRWGDVGVGRDAAAGRARHGGLLPFVVPDNGWKATGCTPSPKLPSRPPAITVHKDGTITALKDGALTVGNGVDYVAGTRQLIHSTLGTFPSATGLGTDVVDYSLQINTNIDRNPVTCAQFGYSSCWTWEQFFYTTDYDGDPINGHIPVIFMRTGSMPTMLQNSMQKAARLVGIPTPPALTTRAIEIPMA